MTIPTSVIPDVPEGTLDPAAGLNASLNPLRALVQAVVHGFTDAPPGSPVDGECWIVGTGSGAFAGQDGNVARRVDEGGTWIFYVAGVSVWSVLNLDDMRIYVYNPSSVAEWSTYPVLASLIDAADDTVADGAGVAVGELYRNGSTLMIRVA